MTVWHSVQSVSQFLYHLSIVGCREAEVTLTFTLMGNIDLWAIFDLTCMYLDCVRKLEYAEKTHACLGKACKLHTEILKPGTILLGSYIANHYITAGHPGFLA